MMVTIKYFDGKLYFTFNLKLSDVFLAAYRHLTVKYIKANRTTFKMNYELMSIIKIMAQILTKAHRLL
jgi:hypothetical protein